MKPEEILSAQTCGHYVALAETLRQWVAETEERQNEPLLVGVAGGQGSGKTTLCQFLCKMLETKHGVSTVVLSLDDFYHTHQTRQRLARRVHPLLATRGVPGTHDLPLLFEALDSLMNAREGDIALPVFDKLGDDRLPSDQWRIITRKPSLILLEGWCVGALPETVSECRKPVNRLEREFDSQGAWRLWVSEQLQGEYAKLFGRLDRLIFMQVPGLNQVIEWRRQQENCLAKANQNAVAKPMNDSELQHFVMHYERITRSMLRTLPCRADIVLSIDKNHEVNTLHFSDNVSGGAR